MSNVVREKLEAYFASLNSTSNRMMADIASSREQYSDEWDTLPPEKQSEVLWRSIVKPEALEKYKNEPKESLDVDYFPVLRIKPGEKIIVDEETSSAKSFGCTWRDEHSAPFRWETQSQLELRLHDSNESSDEKISTLQREIPKDPEPEPEAEPEKHEVKKEEEVKRHTVKRPEVPPPPVPPHLTPPIPPHAEFPPIPRHSEKSEMPIYAKVVKRKSSAKTLVISEMKAHRKAKEEMKPAVPPRMSLELKGEFDISKYKAHTIDIDGIPKTGFDFLDNW